MRAIVTIIILLALAAGGYWGYTKYLAGKADPASTENQFAAATEQSAHFFQSLATQTPDGAPATPDDYTTFANAAASVIAVNYGSIENDVARDVTITLPDNDKVGVRVSELRLWGINASALNEPGENGARAAERIDMRGISWFGFDALTNDMMESYTESITEAVKDIAEDGSEVDMNLDVSFEKYDMRADRMIVDGLTFFAVEAAPAKQPAVEGEEDPTAEMMALLQNYARWARMVSIDAVAVFDMAAELEYKQMEQNTAMSFKAPVSGYKGLRRGDLEAMYVKDVAFDMKFDLPASEFADADAAVAPDAPLVNMAMSGGVDVYSVTDLNLAKVFKYLARGETPPMSDTDLLSFGQWRVLGERYDLNGEPFYSVKETVADLSNFHWFVPTNIRVKSDDIVYDIDGFMTWMADVMAKTEPTVESEEAKVMIEKSMTILKDNGFSTFAFDMDFSGDWNPDDGDLASKFFLNFKEFGKLTYSGDGAIPNYVSIQNLVPAEGEEFDRDALAASFMQHSMFNKFSFVIKDEGGVEKSFALAVAFAELAPKDEPGVAMLRGVSPSDLRVSTSLMVRLSSSQVAAAFPPAKDYINAIADFIEKGGVLKVEANPPAPVSFADFEAMGEPENPQQIVDMLGFSVTREKAK